MNEAGLKSLRDNLDKIDNKVLKLLNERMELVKQVGELKAKSGGSIYRPDRERDIIDRLHKQSHGILDRSAIEAIFLEVFAISRNLELPENIAYLGPLGSFTHQAAESRFGAMSSYLPISTITGVFREVSNKKAKYGVVPIENSSNGIVSETITCFSKYDVKIIAEVMVDIHHTLASTVDNIKDIRRIYSKDIAIEQCREFIVDLGLDEVELIPVESTAKAAKLAVGEKYSAAICSHVGAKLYNLPILFENIEDKGDNRTRFLIVSDFENGMSGDDKTSIVAHLQNKAGALVEFLNSFEKIGVNLTKIKSHTVGGISTFFIEFNAHKDEINIKKIFHAYKEEIKFLGSYVREGDDI
ncbi:MAG: chorismate mutase [Epsilonproteobacteria bacterium]|nr:MAG: chorismate mutase [Campylobacterota bacterium]